MNSDKKHNIAMLGHKRIPSREGGVEIVVEQLAVRMATKGHKVTVYNRKGHHIGGSEFDTDNPELYKNVRIKECFTLNVKGLAAFTSAIAASIAAAFGPYDVVHFHAEGPCVGCFIPKLAGKKVVATIHGLDHQRAKWGRIASFIIMSGEKMAVRYADEIIVLSKNVQDYFMDLYGRRTVLIPNGVERVEPQAPEVISDLWGLNGRDYILFLGRLVPEKGVHYLVEAFKSIDTDKKLVIAGGGSDTSEYVSELKAKAQGDDRIIFTGFTQGPALEELYSNAYIYVLPSDLEGMPLSLLEAMSYGNCCLTSDIPECASVIENQGVTFKAGDVNDLREKLSELLLDPTQVELLSSYSADFICSRYNWDDVTDKTLELYEKKQ